MSPVLERVEVTDIPQALALLTEAYQLPDGTELVDRYAVNRYRKQIELGFYWRVVFTAGETHEQMREWFDTATRARKLGLL